MAARGDLGLVSRLESAAAPLNGPAEGILLNKVDLIGPLDYRREQVVEDLAWINTPAPLLRISARTGQGLDAWLERFAGGRRELPRRSPKRVAGRELR